MTVSLRPERPLALAVHGAGGRMGGSLLQLVRERRDCRVVAAWVRPGDPRLGLDYGSVHGWPPLGVALSPPGEASSPPDVVVDFSTPEALGKLLDLCHDQRLALVSGTTGPGVTTETFAALAAHVPVLWSPNFSPALVALESALGVLRELLPDAETAVLDIHHRAKRDAPSGTARRLAALIGGERSTALASLRVGRVVGEHAIYFEGEGERLELWHRVEDRRVFAGGALRAARWLSGRSPGLHRFLDVLRVPRAGEGEGSPG